MVSGSSAECPPDGFGPELSIIILWMWASDYHIWYHTPLASNTAPGKRVISSWMTRSSWIQFLQVPVTFCTLSVSVFQVSPYLSRILSLSEQ